jgi:hypothetical protein
LQRSGIGVVESARRAARRQSEGREHTTKEGRVYESPAATGGESRHKDELWLNPGSHRERRRLYAADPQLHRIFVV